MNLQSKLKGFGYALAALHPETYHYKRPQKKKGTFVIWAEQGEATSFEADNLKQEQLINVLVDCFTKDEYDPLLDRIQNLLQQWGAWVLQSVQYEDETDYIHYEWSIDIGKGGI